MTVDGKQAVDGASSAFDTPTSRPTHNVMRLCVLFRNRAKDKIEGGKIIRVEAHPIPEHPRPRRTANRVALVGDAAGYVTKCSGEVSQCLPVTATLVFACHRKLLARVPSCCCMSLSPCAEAEVCGREHRHVGSPG